MTPVGLPHSEIPGSKRACRSPRHIAACHVFHRLSVPRHPPSTLSNLTIKCLDLMRSAVPHAAPKSQSCVVHLFYLPIFNCQRSFAVAKTNAERNRLIVLTACLADSLCCSLLRDLLQPGARNRHFGSAVWSARHFPEAPRLVAEDWWS